MGVVLVVAALGMVVGCGGSAGLVQPPPLTTGQSVILVEVRADATQTALAGANLNVAGPGGPQVTAAGPGKFKVTVAPGASYLLTAAAAGFAAQSKVVAVASRNGLASSVTQVFLNLLPALPQITITPAGGEIDAGNGITVRAPAGAVAAPVTATFTVKSLTAVGGEGSTGGTLAAVLGAVDLLPGGTAFTGLVEVVIPRAFLKIGDALVTPGSTFRLWVAGATGEFALSTGTAAYQAAEEEFVLSLPSTGSFQLRPGITLVSAGDLSKDLGTLTSTEGGSILEGTATYDYSTSSSSSDPVINEILTATFGVAPDVDLSAANPPVAGSDGLITEITARQTGERVTVHRGGALVGTFDYYGSDLVVVGLLRPPRTGTG